MFSLSSFYDIINKNLLEPIGIASFYFNKFGSISWNDIEPVGEITYNSRYLFFSDQEPIGHAIFDYAYAALPNDASKFRKDLWFAHFNVSLCELRYFDPILRIGANSEICKSKDAAFANYQITDWYYFFHGFAALDWFRNTRYYPPVTQFDKVFITFNHLVLDKRSYRLQFVANLYKHGLQNYGHIAMAAPNRNELIMQEIRNPYSQLSTQAKKDIINYLLPCQDQLVIDTSSPDGTLSANDRLDVLSMGLWHLVTETVFYDSKLHLTEKIFKPIVARRPFILIAAPGNLKYLKKYGFKSFDKWIDESYDEEFDHDKRIEKIISVVIHLCGLTQFELEKMYTEMQEILEYNFNWFFNEFRTIICDELVDNFKMLLINWNAGKDKSFRGFIDYSKLDFDQVKLRLAGNSF